MFVSLVVFFVRVKCEIKCNLNEFVAGCVDYDRLRALFYPGTDVFLVFFSIRDHETLEHVKQKWIPEVSSLKLESIRTHMLVCRSHGIAQMFRGYWWV